MTIHVIGGGLSGLAAAVALAEKGRQVVVYEAAAQPGGRCRSYHDRALDRVIDNGNHMVLSGNLNVRRYLDLVGAKDRLVEPSGDGFDFLDMLHNRRFTVRPNNGPIPWWIGVSNRRVPNTTVFQYLASLKLAFASANATVAEILPHDELYRILWEPLAVSALNTPADEASARGFWQVLVKTLARGGSFARPLIACETLANTFVTPAEEFLSRHGIVVRLGTRIKMLAYEGDHIVGIESDNGTVDWETGDKVILATPPAVARRLLDQLITPVEDEAIVNAHFATSDPENRPIDVIAIVGGAAQWVFRRPGLTSVTVSAARQMVDEAPESLAKRLWADVAHAFPDLGDAIPPFRIIKEKRATIRQSPADERLRPSLTTSYLNLWLAGDWTRTGLPATIEGSLMSGFHAAEAALKV